MFTGIVEELGRVDSFERRRLRIGATTVLDDVAIGDSIAVNGCCLTVVAFGDGWWEADVSDETLSPAPAWARCAPGDRVNLERPVRLDDRLGGHLVQGHVDAVGEIVDPVPRPAGPRARSPLLRYVVEKGSITVDGISLTVVEAARRRLHRGGHPPHRRGHDPRLQGPRRPGEPRGRRHRQVRRTADPVWRQLDRGPHRTRRSTMMTIRSPRSRTPSRRIARGEIVVVVDDEDRENEGDLIMAAEAATPETIAFFVRHTSGVICVAPDGRALPTSSTSR